MFVPALSGEGWSVCESPLVWGVRRPGSGSQTRAGLSEFTDGAGDDRIALAASVEPLTVDMAALILGILIKFRWPPHCAHQDCRHGRIASVALI